MVEGLKLEAAAGGGLAERSKERGERSQETKRSKETQRREKKIKIKTQKSIPVEIYIPAETHRNPPKQPKHTETP